MFQIFIILFLLEACSNRFKSSEKIMVSAHSTDKTSEKAMRSAYQKARQTLNDLGCDKNKGIGNVTYKKIKSGFMAEAIYYIPPDDCRKNTKCRDVDWAFGPIMTQSDSWIKFSGTGVSPKRSEANKFSKKDALRHLAEGCKVSQEKVEFIERCEDFTSKAFVVMTRASIKKDQCHH